MRAHFNLLDAIATPCAKSKLSKNTRRAYAADIQHFCDNGGEIPADPKAVRRYLRHCDGFYPAATLKRRLMAIHHEHVKLELQSPIDASVKKLLKHIRRKESGS